MLWHLLEPAGVNSMPMAPGSLSQGAKKNGCLSGGGWVRAGSRGVGDPRSLWEEAILGKSRAGIMNAIKGQAASKAMQKKLQQGDSTSSLSTDEKLSCDFHVRVIIAKVHSAYLLNLMRMSGLKA